MDGLCRVLEFAQGLVVTKRDLSSSFVKTLEKLLTPTNLIKLFKDPDLMWAYSPT